MNAAREREECLSYITEARCVVGTPLGRSQMPKSRANGWPQFFSSYTLTVLSFFYCVFTMEVIVGYIIGHGSDLV
jgi:hypothetical protein